MSGQEELYNNIEYNLNSLYDSKARMDKVEKDIKVIQSCHDKNLILNNEYLNDKITKITRLS